MLPALLMALSGCLSLGLILLAFSGPSASKAKSRRIDGLKNRHSGVTEGAMQAQMRRALTQRDTKLDGYANRFLPKPEMLRARLAQTGRSWTLGQYFMACMGIALVVALLLIIKHVPIAIALFLGLAVGLGVPHKVIGVLIKRRVLQFNAKFPDAIELLVRGLRSGLPITETLSVVGHEVPGPVGVEFRLIGDRIKIGRTMEAAMQETADRLGTPEFQFFCITLQIQRETGGNLAETLANLADVLRKRAQMKLKIKAMSSESKASAYIVGSLPFFVFGTVYFMNPDYMMGFFHETRLMIAGGIGLTWMGIGAFIMAKMVNFEI
ncbi:type II secretion system F family protein [Sphingomonas oryzagri]|jgi:tight adherence protein B|uniref:Type II secretion system F family protein n=1 Tax=Sphingomonas oryzagri TaxID=3042314 RepID=A0ABT6MWX9_9SPHN|nr:type II secretion system F family protein [Sphingomonas oryzagri]MDH7637507.1 type II secretion system F family protein [Sphingomonas oryzagri]